MPSPSQSLAAELAARYAAAVRARDLEAFMGLYDPAVRVFDAWNRFSVQGAEGWRAGITQWFASHPDATFETDVRVLDCHGDGALLGITAFVTYRARAAGGEVLHSLDQRLTWLVSSAPGDPRIVHEHTSNPLDDKTAKGVMQLPPDQAL